MRVSGLTRALLAVSFVFWAGCSGEPDEDAPVSNLAPEIIPTGVSSDPGQTFASVRCLGVVDDLVCLGGDGVVWFIDVSHPWRLPPANRFPLAGQCGNLFGGNGVLYHVAADGAELSIIDVRVPSAPAVVASWTAAAPVRDAAMSQNIAYLALGAAGLQIVDLSDPARPVALSMVSGLGVARQVAIASSWAYVAGGTNGISVVDVSHPTSPSLIGVQPMDYPVSLIAALGQRRCVVAGPTKLEVFDFQDPRKPARIGRFALEEGVAGLCSVDGIALVRTVSSRLFLVDMSHPDQAVGWPVYIDGAQAVTVDVRVRNGLVFLAAASTGLRMLQWIGPSDPARSRVADTPGVARAIRVKGSRCYVADGEAGLQIFDVSQAPEIRFLGGNPSGGDAWGVDVEGDFAYVANSTAGIAILDVSNPVQPRLAGRFLTVEPALAVAVSRARAYVACERGGLLILDVENPAAVRVVGQKSTPAARNLQIRGERVHLADRRGGYWSIDVSNPSFPLTIGRCCVAAGPQPDTEWMARDLVVNGAYTCIASPETGLRILDLNDESNPVRVLDQGPDAYSVTAQGTRLYVGRAHSLEVLDITDPLKPVTLNRYILAGTPWDMELEGDYLFLAMGKGGLLVLNVTNRPRFIDCPRLERGQLVLKWMGGPAVGLEKKDNLEGSSWEPVSATQGRSNWELPIAQARAFYRLTEPNNTPQD